MPIGLKVKEQEGKDKDGDADIEFSASKELVTRIKKEAENMDDDKMDHASLDFTNNQEIDNGEEDTKVGVKTKGTHNNKKVQAASDLENEPAHNSSFEDQETEGKAEESVDVH